MVSQEMIERAKVVCWRTNTLIALKECMKCKDYTTMIGDKVLCREME